MDCTHKSLALSILVGMVAACSNLGAAEPLVYKKDIQINKETLKENSIGPFILGDVVFADDKTLIVTAGLADFKTGLARIDIETGKSKLVSWQGANYGMDRELYLDGEKVWYTPRGKAFKHADLSVAFPHDKLTPEEKKFLEKEPWARVYKGKIHSTKIEEKIDAEITFKTSMGEKIESKEITITPTFKLRDVSLHTGIADPDTWAFLFLQNPNSGLTPHWLVRPELAEGQVISFKLPHRATGIVAIDKTRYLLGTQRGGVQILDVTKPEKLISIETKFKDSVNGIVITKDKRFAICSSMDYQADNLIIIDLETNKIIFKHQFKDVSVHRMSFSPDEKTLAVVADPKNISLFEVNLPAKK